MALAMHTGRGFGSTPASRRETLSTILKWLGRGLSLALLLFWGAFFVEHVTEWYVRPKGGYPPLWVLAGMVFHFGMLVGLLVSLRWGLLGAAITLAATSAFLVHTGIHAGMPLIVLINLAPIACFAASWLLSRPPAGPKSE